MNAGETIRDEREMIGLGHREAAMARAHAVYALTGGLGAGKTHWTKGLVAGLGCPADVTSPTFSLVHEYRGGRLPVLHFDCYRLDRARDLLAIGWDEYLDEPAVVVVEWADLFPQLLPTGTKWLAFSVNPDGTRSVTPLDGPPGEPNKQS
ncbi:MAG: tRNA (adenosine(37)-N6)-threonylcarbamoyltransferase complex ATPase subunit type 1 TsaE [Verrucomicrobia bacterium]|nr:tRNA (adenosine(37)-N6)-threonylcarbamoyltransferase complex ATPase subunit type 1 TsaE [Verrucomicrobiota bacterium]